jgi:HAD superfamily hydrolase (TIGR01509 family)
LIKAIVFDFDGVIIDTETPEYDSWENIFSAYGTHLDQAVWSRLIGGAESFDVIQHLQDLTGLLFDRQKLREGRRAAYLRTVEASPVLDGVVNYVEAAAGLGLGLAMASSSDGEWVRGHLERLGLASYFGVVRTRDDVAHAKPEPDLFLSAVEALGVRPENAVAIEDSPNGIASAKQAGLYCVAVPNQMTRDLCLDGADLRLESLAEMSLAQLVHRANSGRGR